MTLDDIGMMCFDNICKRENELLDALDVASVSVPDYVVASEILRKLTLDQNGQSEMYTRYASLVVIALRERQKHKKTGGFAE